MLLLKPTPEELVGRGHHLYMSRHRNTDQKATASRRIKVDGLKFPYLADTRQADLLAAQETQRKRITDRRLAVLGESAPYYRAPDS